MPWARASSSGTVGSWSWICWKEFGVGARLSITGLLRAGIRPVHCREAREKARGGSAAGWSNVKSVLILAATGDDPAVQVTQHVGVQAVVGRVGVQVDRQAGAGQQAGVGASQTQWHDRV